MANLQYTSLGKSVQDDCHLNNNVTELNLCYNLNPKVNVLVLEI